MKKLFFILFPFSLLSSEIDNATRWIVLSDGRELSEEHYAQKKEIIKRIITSTSINFFQKKRLYKSCKLFSFVPNDLKEEIKSVLNLEIEDLDCNFVYVVRNCLEPDNFDDPKKFTILDGLLEK